jgi:hypothetical protein
VTGNATFGGTITGPSVAATVFSIDNGNASAINIGGATATTLNLGRSGQTQALLGNGTVAGTFGVSGATTLSSTLGVTGNTTLGGTLTGPAAATFTIDSGGVNAINIGGTNATTLNLGKSGQTQALLGNGTVAGTLGVTGATTLTGTLTANAAATFNSTVKVGSTGTALNEVRTGTCSIPGTTVNGFGSGGNPGLAITCTIAGGAQDLLTNNYAITVSPRTAIPNYLSYTVSAPTTSNIVLWWINVDAAGTNHTTGAITFNWVAVR